MKVSIRSAAVLVLCAELFLTGAGSALARDTTPAQPQDGSGSSPGTDHQADRSRTQTPTPTPPARNSFRPSEEVSPDQEVDFPADI